MNYFDESSVDEWISYPHFDLYDFAERIGSSSLGVSTQADSLKTAVQDCIISSWGGISYSGHTSGENGLGFFFPDGDNIYTLSDGSTAQHYYLQWWYTAEDTNSLWPGNYYGKLDFCNSDNDGNVEGWRELLEYWYDPAVLPNTGHTPSSY